MTTQSSAGFQPRRQAAWWARVLLRLDAASEALHFFVWLAWLGAAVYLAKDSRVIPTLILAVFVLGLLRVILRLWANATRERHVRTWPFPPQLRHKLMQKHPQLRVRDAILVERGLRQFFLACVKGRGASMAMPSRVMDDLWHDFILDTRAYASWCAGTVGYFLHHEPVTQLGADAQRNDSLRRVWFWSCVEENISPRAPSRLPLLFALDSKFNIANGFRYSLDAGIVAGLAADAAAVQAVNNLTGGDGGGSHPGSAADFGGADAGATSGGGDFGGGGADGSGCGGSCGGGGD